MVANGVTTESRKPQHSGRISAAAEPHVSGFEQTTGLGAILQRPYRLLTYPVNESKRKVPFHGSGDGPTRSAPNSLDANRKGRTPCSSRQSTRCEDVPEEGAADNVRERRLVTRHCRSLPEVLRKMNEMVEVISSVEDLHSVIREIQGNQPQIRLAFRGQHRDLLPLPSAQRQISDLNYQAVHEIVHSAWLDASASLFSTCARSNHPLDRITASMAILQHYGFRSWFVDVTADPSIAAWFAVHSYEAEKIFVQPEHEECFDSKRFSSSPRPRCCFDGAVQKG